MIVHVSVCESEKRREREKEGERGQERQGDRESAPMHMPEINLGYMPQPLLNLFCFICCKKVKKLSWACAGTRGRWKKLK